jgi:hypothetical protein
MVIESNGYRCVLALVKVVPVHQAPLVVSQGCHSSVIVVFKWSCSGVTLVLQLCHKGVTVV